MRVHELKFVNFDATPKTTVLHVTLDAVRPIMAWYGAFFAGDRYRVTLDGQPLAKDMNGEMVGAVPQPPP